MTGNSVVMPTDTTNGKVSGYAYNGDTQHMTASIVKVALLETLLSQTQDENRSLTSTDRSLANRMRRISASICVCTDCNCARVVR